MPPSLKRAELERLSQRSLLTLKEIVEPLEQGLPLAALVYYRDFSYSEIRRRLERFERELETPDRRCAWCGESLKPGSRSHRVYCSGRCRVAAHRAA